jgi:hypothetical protein
MREAPVQDGMAVKLLLRKISLFPLMVRKLNDREMKTQWKTRRIILRGID